MPKTAEMIDALREAFGADVINAAIRRGMRGEPGFYACENGLEFGTPSPPPERFVTLASLVLEEDIPGTEAFRRKHGRAMG